MSFDLNINNYSRDELIEMFELPAGSDVDRITVENKEAQMRAKIMTTTGLKKDQQIQTINFLSKAKHVILNTANHAATQKDTFNTNYELKPASANLDVYPTGFINPIRKRTVKKYINIDTRFRDNYFSTKSTNFNITLPTEFNDVVQMQLVAAEIPTSYYTISGLLGNNFFSLHVVTDAPGAPSTSTILFIPDGNYTQQTIIDWINSTLTELGEPFNQISFIVNLIETHTGTAQTLIRLKENIDSSNNDTATTVTQITIDFQANRVGIADQGTPLPLKFGWMLGFRHGIYTGAVEYASEGIIDVTGTKYMYLMVDDRNGNVNTNAFVAALNSSMLSNNILARISQQADLYNILCVNERNNVVAPPREYFGPVKISGMQIQLIDEYGRCIDLNNMDYSICIELITLYD